jgi:hypothetical protein
LLGLLQLGAIGFQAHIASKQNKIIETQNTIMTGQREAADAQSGFMRDGLVHAKLAAEAAKTSADVARDALHLTEAADIHLDKIVTQVSGVLTPDSRIRLVFKNFGRTRAINANVVWEEWVAAPPKGLIVTNGHQIIPPQGEHPINSESTVRQCAEAAGAPVSDLVSGTIPFGFVAAAKFDDVFGNTITRVWVATFEPPMGFTKGLTKEERTKRE